MLRIYGQGLDGGIVDPADAGPLPGGAAWLDLFEPTHEEERLAERWLGLDVPTREELSQIEPSSRLFEKEGALYLTLSTLCGVDEGHPSSEPIGFLLVGDRLVTVRYVEPRPIRVFAERVRREPGLASGGMAVLVWLLDAIIDRLADELEASGGEIERISAQVFQRGLANGSRIPAARLRALLERIGRAQSLLARVRETAVSSARLIAFLLGSARSRADDCDRTHIASLATDVASLNDHSGFLADNLTFLLNASLGFISIEQQAATKIFSVAAVVFMPPTMVAGIYGMNFAHMPELSWRLGYPWALALMLLSAVLPYWFFRRRGWL